MGAREVILRSTRTAGNSRFLQASMTDDGDLVISGQDLGDEVERIFGVREYEWTWTVRSSDVPELATALGTPSGVLEALTAQFSGDGAAGLKAFLEEHQVPHEVWSRLGD